MPDTKIASRDKLKKFFETATVARRSTDPLSKGVAVNIHFRDVPEALPVPGSPDCHFLRVPAGGTVAAGGHPDPDFTLWMPHGAADKLIAMTSDDPGDFGIEFFKLCMTQDAAAKIYVRLHAGPLRLLSHGYFGVVKAGGWKMLGWLKEKGVFGLSGFKDAVTRLRERSNK